MQSTILFWVIFTLLIITGGIFYYAKFNAPASQSSLDKTNNVWLTTSDELLGITVSYPPRFTSSIDQTGHTRTLKLRSPGFPPEPADTDGVGEIIFSLDENPRNLTIEEYYSGNPGPNLEAPIGTMFINGVEVFMYSPSVTSSVDIVVVIPLKNKYLKIVDRGAALQVNRQFEQILSTLKIHQQP